VLILLFFVAQTHLIMHDGKAKLKSQAKEVIAVGEGKRFRGDEVGRERVE
jgi:co-chaperonin GroES (HSP10)